MFKLASIHDVSYYDNAVVFNEFTLMQHNDYSVWKNVLVSVDVAGLVSMNYVTETVPKTPSKSARVRYYSLRLTTSSN